MIKKMIETIISFSTNIFVNEKCKSTFRDNIDDKFLTLITYNQQK
jgi:hypothetical protein